MLAPTAPPIAPAKGEVIGGDVDGAAGGKQTVTVRVEMSSAKPGRRRRVPPARTEDARGSADIVEVRDGEDTFVDGGAQ
jgi:hypothetical protein